MDYFKGILSGFAAIFIAEFVFSWPVFSTSKAAGLAALAGNCVESIYSPGFWVIGLLSFCLFFAASRSKTIVRVLFFWIPTLFVSTVGFAFLGLSTYLIMQLRHR